LIVTADENDLNDNTNSMNFSVYLIVHYCLLFSSRVRVRIRVRIRFSAWL